MISLIGHGYVGDHIAQELKKQGVPYNWISHNHAVPDNTSVIINAAGYTGTPNVDACEDQIDETVDGNVTFPLMLEGNHSFIPMIHITSACVYDGYTEGGWCEEDPPNFGFGVGSVYSGSKAMFQSLMAPYLNKSYLLRIRLPFGHTPHPKNLLTKLQNYPKLIDVHNSLSCVLDVARTAVFFALNRPPAGIYNVCNPGSVDAREIATRMGLTKEWFTEQEFRDAVRAPRSNCTINTDKLQRVFPLQHVNQALDFCIAGLKNQAQ